MEKALTFRQMADEIFTRIANDPQQGNVVLDQAAVRAVLHTLGDVVADEISSGINVNLPGVVHFKVVHRPAKPRRLSRNPQTGEERMAPPKPASFALKARPATTLKGFLPSTRSAIGKALASDAEKDRRKRERRTRERERALA